MAKVKDMSSLTRYLIVLHTNPWKKRPVKQALGKIWLLQVFWGENQRSGWRLMTVLNAEALEADPRIPPNEKNSLELKVT